MAVLRLVLGDQLSDRLTALEGLEASTRREADMLIRSNAADQDHARDLLTLFHERFEEID